MGGLLIGRGLDTRWSLVGGGRVAVVEGVVVGWPRSGRWLAPPGPWVGASAVAGELWRGCGLARVWPWVGTRVEVGDWVSRSMLARDRFEVGAEGDAGDQVTGA